MRRIPISSDRLSDSWNAIAEKVRPRPGTASNAMDIVVARTTRPTSTAAQYAKAVATGPTYKRAVIARMERRGPVPSKIVANGSKSRTATNICQGARARADV
jgi:hypothetical protein